MTTLRTSVLPPLLTQNAVAKAQAVLALSLDLPIDASAQLAEPPGIPGRPNKPLLVHAKEIKQLPLVTTEGRAALLHALAHIELNAIDLALDVVWRFADMPEQFYLDWVRIAQEEALHFMLLREHLVSIGHDYGDFNAHNTLWDIAEKTKGDVLARIALVPRLMEARGLDATPGVKNKLVSVRDIKGGKILDIIMKDEIDHVATGNHWYRWICAQRQLDPITTFAHLLEQYSPPKLRPPFNLEARRLAGFLEEELLLLG
jgi:uncharacterized ferritin-like protein (DUF455 family)